MERAEIIFLTAEVTVSLASLTVGPTLRQRMVDAQRGDTLLQAGFREVESDISGHFIFSTDSTLTYRKKLCVPSRSTFEKKCWRKVIVLSFMFIQAIQRGTRTETILLVTWNET